MRIYIIFVIACIVATAYSCRKLVTDIFPEFEPVPVVHSIVREGLPVEVRLSWTAKIDTSRIRFIDNAVIDLYAGDRLVETLTCLGNGVYTGTSAAESSVHYRCRIDIPDYGLIDIADSLPAKARLFDVRYIEVAGRDEEGIAYPAIRFSFENNPNEKQYFEAVIYEIFRKEMFPGSGSKLTGNPVLPGPMTDPILQSEGLPIFVFSNERIKTTTYTMTINYLGESYSTMQTQIYPTVLELRSVSYDYYRYLRQKYLYEQSFEKEFGRETPSVNLFSNIKNGYGIFAGYASARSDTLNYKSNR